MKDGKDGDAPLMELVGMMPSAVPPYPPDTMEVSLRLGPDTITCCRSCKWRGRTGTTKEGRGSPRECRADVYSLEGDKPSALLAGLVARKRKQTGGKVFDKENKPAESS